MSLSQDRALLTDAKGSREVQPRQWSAWSPFYALALLRAPGAVCSSATIRFRRSPILSPGFHWSRLKQFQRNERQAFSLLRLAMTRLIVMLARGSGQ